MAYSLEFDERWDAYFSKLDRSIQERLWKKIIQLKRDLPSRHLKKGVDLYVSEVGQYRLVYKLFIERNAKRLYFVGDHKEYERWLGQ